jgi:hypothetical protein
MANFVLADQDPQVSVDFPEVFFILGSRTSVSFGLGFRAWPERIWEANQTKDADCFACDENDDHPKRRNRAKPYDEQKITDMLCVAEITIASRPKKVFMRWSLYRGI